MKNVLLLVVLSFFMLSCYTQVITVNPDKKSGTISLNYSINAESIPELSGIIAQVSSAGQGGNNIDVMSLIDENTFKKNFKNSDMVKLKSVKIEPGEVYNGTVVFTFTDFEKAFNELPVGFVKPQIVREGNTITISQKLVMKELDPDNLANSLLMQLAEDDPEYYNKLMKTVKFDFEIITPTPVISHQGVTLLSKNRVKFSFNITELLNAKEKFFSVKF